MLKKVYFSIPTTLVKYLFVLAIAIYGYVRVRNPVILVVAIVEILLVFIICNELAWHSRLAASIASSVVLLLICVQLFVLIFSNTFATLVMLTNLDSLEDLSGKFSVYGAAALVTLLFLTLPQNPIDIVLPEAFDYIGGIKCIIFVLFLWEALLIELNGAAASPLFSYADLAFQQVEVTVAENELKAQPNTTLDFYKPEIKDYRPRPEGLVERPNIVLIFTEGLSQNIVDDERQVMPNVAAWQARSITFDNYYNHTFATYRGLIGQLFSGYQHNNYDANTLVSLPQILRDEGYVSRFLNVEGYNKEFTAYLNTLGFDEVTDLHDKQKRGPVGDGYSDKMAYEELFYQMEELDRGDAPYLLSIYTFGTHASFDSADEKFGDGTDTELNKFYDLDCQFGAFMDHFETSQLTDDTLIVFTTDHCTYADLYFSEAFPDWKRDSMELDAIPLFFYYKGVTPEAIDVSGRNSLDLAPTLLDLIDVTGENYFLGTSLFGPKSEAEKFETYFSNGSMTSLTSDNCQVKVATGPEAEDVKKRMWSYYAAKRQEPLRPDDVAYLEEGVPQAGGTAGQTPEATEGVAAEATAATPEATGQTEAEAPDEGQTTAREGVQDDQVPLEEGDGTAEDATYDDYDHEDEAA